MRWLTLELLAMSAMLGCTSGNDADQAQYPEPQYSQPQVEEQSTQNQGYQNAPQVPEQTYAQPQSPYQTTPQVQPQPQMQPQGRQHLGIAIQPMSGELRSYFGAPADRGVLVSHVAPGSIADRAGLHVGDVLVFVGGRLIQNVADVRSALAERTDQTLRLDVVRHGQPMQLQASFGPPRYDEQNAEPVM